MRDNIFVCARLFGTSEMAFRADEAATGGYEKTRSYLIPREFTPEQREQAERGLQKIISECGPPVDGYPTWHPLVAQHVGRSPETRPNDRCGYEGLDHTRYFTHGFITCPYDDGQSIIDSVNKLNYSDIVTITANRLQTPFYSIQANPIIVRCEWSVALELNHTVPKSLAVPLMLEQELPCWRWAERSETWETMRPYLLGVPHGSRSSLFVTQDTALALKNIYLAMTDSGMFGPIKLDGR